MSPKIWLVLLAVLVVGGAAFLALSNFGDLRPDAVGELPSDGGASPPSPPGTAGGRPVERRTDPAHVATDLQDRPVDDAKTTLASGRVVTFDGDPILGAGISGYWVGTDRRVATNSRDDGWFVLEGPNRALRRLIVAASGFAPRQFHRVPLGTTLTVVLERGVTFRGTVRKAGAVPVARAVVRLDPRGRADLSHLETATNDEGRFTIHAVGPGAWDLGILTETHPPLHELGITIPAPAGLEKDFLLLPPLKLSGRVVDAKTGRGIAAAQVEILDHIIEGRMVEHRSRRMGPYLTRQDGGFESDPVGPGTLRVLARAQGYASVVSDHTVDTVQARDAVLSLHPGIVIEGTVADAQGRATSKALVVLRPDGNHLPLDTFAATAPFLFGAEAWADEVSLQWPMVRADAQGKFRIRGVSRGLRGVLQAVDPEGRAAPSSPTTITAGAERGPLVLVLRPGVPVSGRVLGEEGEAVHDATVYVGGARTLSDPNGRFSIPNVPSDAEELLVQHEHYITYAAPVAGRTVWDIRLKAGSIVQGLVLDTLGRPIIGAFVTGRTVPEGAASGHFLSRSNSDLQGHFRLSGFHAERVRVHFDMPGFESLVLSDVVPDRRPLSVTLRAAPWTPGGHVLGHVLDGASRAPLLGFSVEGLGTGQIQFLEGRFLAQNLPVGLLALTVSKAGYQSAEIHARVEAEATTELPPLELHRGYTVRVDLGVSGKTTPLVLAPGQMVIRELAGQGNPPWALKPQVDPRSGRLTLAALRSGSYQMEIRVAGLEDDVARFEVPNRAIELQRLLTPHRPR